ncbi:hypothetical protein F0562_022346 [Nyssa sinensis]|uniref:Uncharacterized protein n=1 Tax=Nyssa sinensis TaxID=561372 RepID=A0A5J5BNV4_9ASTE|nr:hypothetical protein F0562_022346 [Nyssa sinensis]
MRPGGSVGTRGSRFAFGLNSTFSSDSLPLRPYGGFKTGDWWFEGCERVQYTQDQLLQLREVADVFGSRAHVACYASSGGMSLPPLEALALASSGWRLWLSCGGASSDELWMLTRAKRQLLQTLRSEFEMLRMKSGESVADYFSRTMGIVNKMQIHEDKTEDVTIIEKILRSMTPKFNFVVCSIEESKDIDELSIEELQGSLQVHE